MSKESIVALIFSITTAVTAIAAIIISIMQYCQSNKHKLFDRRLNLFLLVESLKNLFEEKKHILTNYTVDSIKECPIDYDFMLFVNCDYLESTYPAIKNPDNLDKKRVLLLKREEMKKYSTEATLIFGETKGKQISNFIYNYQEMLFAMFQMQVAKMSYENSGNKAEYLKSQTYLDCCKKVLDAFQQTKKSSEVLNLDAIKKKMRLAK